MNGPSEGFREEISYQLERLDSEYDLEQVLDRIETALLEDVETSRPGDQDPDELLAAVDSWAGLASATVARFYAPASPWPRSVAGWSRRAVRRLRSIANTLVPPLKQACGVVGATSFSVSVGFPWGISIGLSW